MKNHGMLNNYKHGSFNIRCIVGCLLILVSGIAHSMTMDTTGDSTTRTSNPNSNFGDGTFMRVKAYGEKFSFVEFDVSSLGTTVGSAILNLYVQDLRTAGTLLVHPIQSSWTEFGITHNNKPGLGAAQAAHSLSASDEGGYVQIDITALVQQWAASPGTAFGIGLTTTDSLHALFDTLEAGNAAFIEVTTDGGPPANTRPTVSISTPSDNSSFDEEDIVSFIATANDTEEGELSSSLSWSSSRDGFLGSGASLSTDALSVGSHTITASVTDQSGAGLTGSDTVTLQITSENSGSSTTLNTIGDSTTRTSSANSNFGDETFMRVKAYGEKFSFVEFDVSSLGTTVGSAVLNLYVQDLRTAGTLLVHPIQSSWTEFGITHNNKPGLGAAQAAHSLSASDEGGYVQIDITALVQQWATSPGAAFGIGLTTTDSLHALFDTLEAGNAAFIEVTTDGGPPANTRPTVSISTPSDNSSFDEEDIVSFTATANDTEEGELSSSLSWSSSRDGFLGSGASLSTDALSVGSHTITASVTDQSGAGLTGSDTVTLQITSENSGSSTTLNTIGDSTTRTSSANSNFGDETFMRVKAYGEKFSFVEFDVSSLGTTVGSAVLNLYVQDLRTAGTLLVHPIQSSWTEFGITHNNKPGLGAAQAAHSLSASDEGGYVQIDITALVQQWATSPGTAFGIGLTTTDSLHALFDTREAGNSAFIDVSSTGGPAVSPLTQNFQALASNIARGRLPTTAGSTYARDYIIDELSSFAQGEFSGTGNAAFEQSFSGGINIVARLPGSGQNTDVIILGAHYDHLGSNCETASPQDSICNGATDNATGVAAVLEIGRRISEADPMARDLLLAFWDAEETGLHGSDHYLNNSSVPLNRIETYVNIDIAGTNLRQSLENISFATAAETGGTALQQLVGDSLQTSSLDVIELSAAFSENQSDHQRFIESAIPSVFFTDATGPCYHTAQDEIGIVDVEKLNEQTDMMFTVVQSLLNSGENLSFSASTQAVYADVQKLLTVIQTSQADWADMSAANQSWLQNSVAQLQQIIADGESEFSQADRNWLITAADNFISIMRSGACDGFL